MGSLENGVILSPPHPPLKSVPSFRPLSSRTDNNNRQSFGYRPRSRFTRFLLSEKVDYLQWICTIAVFLFVIFLVQAFLPGSVIEDKSVDPNSHSGLVSSTGDLLDLQEFGVLDFGDGISFDPSKLLEKFEKEAKELNLSSTFSRPLTRSGIRKPQLALVFADLSVEPGQLLMISVASSLLEIGYGIQVYALENGPASVAWRSIGVPINIIESNNKPEIAVDWLNYDGILVNSLEARDVILCLAREPFKSLPVIWTVHERSLALRLGQYASNEQTQLVSDWKRAFTRASVVVFPNYFLPLMYSMFDAGNYFVIPGSPDEAWEAKTFMATHSKDDLRIKMGHKIDDFVIAVVGSEFSYSGLWLEHAFVLKALLPVFSQLVSNNSSRNHLKVSFLSRNSTSSYKLAIKAIAHNLGYSNESMEQISINEDSNSFLDTADLVIYGSFLEEQAFPEVLIQAMCFEKPIVVPDLAMIKKYVDDRVNGYLFPKDNIGALTQVLQQAITNTKLSPLARNIASIAKGPARNLMVSETIEGYSFILEKVLKFPSEVAHPKTVTDIPPRLKKEWQWHLFAEIGSPRYWNRTFRSYSYLNKVEELWYESHSENSSAINAISEAFSYTDWEEEKAIEMVNAKKRREEEELRDRTDQPHGTWEDVYRGAKRADRAKNDLRERDDRELERTGQPLTIYEPYFGEGTWPFLHHSSLYRGIGLSSRGRRSGEDDLDASSRLSLLNNPYYRDVLGEYGAFFAIANRVDRVHKNAWIGFQSWRAAARKGSLTKVAESALLEAIEERKHGDTLYFWARMDKDPRNPSQLDFWSFCDAINAGNCRFAVAEAFRRMYGTKHNLDLPPMPVNGDSWSVMHSWALPTKSFLEFVMFSRMFVDALDAQMYDEHHRTGLCYLSLLKDRHCYSRVLELMVNVWAYHSARRMVFVNPETGAMQEQHKLNSRKGQMWIRWFSYATLKSMDEDLAEELDSDNPTRRWLWPSTGEVFWQGIYERERNQRNRQKEKRKQQSKDKISRMRRRVRQKVIGKYVKPPPDDKGESNSTAIE